MGQSPLPLQPYPQFVCLEKNSERYKIIVGPPQGPPLLSKSTKNCLIPIQTQFELLLMLPQNLVLVPLSVKIYFLLPALQNL